MDDPRYIRLLMDYIHRFGDPPPSILTNEGASKMMSDALERGAPIMKADMNPCCDGWESMAVEQPSGKLGWTYVWSL